MSEDNGRTSVREGVNDPFGIIANTMVSRMSVVQRMLDPRRNIDFECGYPETNELNPQLYFNLYLRDPIARRVMDVFPKETWQVQPSIYETEDQEVTEFEDALEELSRSLMTVGEEKNYYQDQEGSPLNEAMCRADVVSGINQYGIILLGLDDGQPLLQPAAPREGQRMLYLRVFPELYAPVASYDTDPTSPRYGQPNEYSVQFGDPQQVTQGAATPTMTHQVHWTRVIHIPADDVITSNISGQPRAHPVIDRLIDLKKLYGGSAEMYWQGALPGISVESLPQLGPEVRVNEASLKNMMEQRRYGLQRDILLKGMQAKILSPTVVDPTPQINVQIEAICIKLGCPVRVFKGSERGELASSQDDANWNDRIKHRQKFHTTPRIVIPLINRLIWLRVLPEPQGFSVWWPDITSQSLTEKAQVASALMGAISAFVQSGAESVLPLYYLFTQVLGWTDNEANAIIDEVKSQLEDQTPDSGSPLLKLVGGITGVLEMFDKFKAGAISEETLKQLLILFYGVSDERATAIIADGLPEPPTPALPPVPPGTASGSGRGFTSYARHAPEQLPTTAFRESVATAANWGSGRIRMDRARERATVVAVA